MIKWANCLKWDGKMGHGGAEEMSCPPPPPPVLRKSSNPKLQGVLKAVQRHFKAFQGRSKAFQSHFIRGISGHSKAFQPFKAF